jgi:hypothetical protein
VTYSISYCNFLHWYFNWLDTRPKISKFQNDEINFPYSFPISPFALPPFALLALFQRGEHLRGCFYVSGSNWGICSILLIRNLLIVLIAFSLIMLIPTSIMPRKMPSDINKFLRRILFKTDLDLSRLFIIFPLTSIGIKRLNTWLLYKHT